MVTKKIKTITKILILFLALSCVGLIFSLLIKMPGKAEASYVQSGEWKTTSTSEKGTWNSRGAGNVGITESGDYTKISNLNAWGTGAVYNKAVELNGLTVSFYSDGINTTGISQDVFGFTLGSGTVNNYPTQSETSFCVSFWNRLWSQTRLAIAENHAANELSGSKPIAYVDAACKSKMIFGTSLPEYVFTCTEKVGVSMKFEYVSESKVWKITTTVLYGTSNPNNHLTCYVKDESIKAASGTEASKKVYVCAFGYIGDASPATEVHQYIKVKEARELSATYNQNTGFTTINGFGVWGERYYYNNKLSLNGLKVGFYTENIGKHFTRGSAIGFGFIKNATDFAPESNGLCVTFYPAGSDILLAINKTHEYTDTVCYKEQTLKTKYLCNGTTTYARLPYAEKFGLNFEFKDLGTIAGNDVWSITITPLYGDSGAIGNSTTLYFNGNILSNVADKGPCAYLSTYGWIGSQQEMSSVNGSFKLETDYLKISNMGSGTKQALTTSAVKLDGTSVYMFTNNFNTAVNGQAVGFGLSNSVNGYPPESNNAFCATIWCGIYGAGQNRVFFGTSHDYNKGSIAYSDDELKNGSLGHADQLVYNKDAATGVKLTFHDMSSLNNTWRIDIQTVCGESYLGQSTSIFVSKTYFNSVLNSGKCYIIAYAMSPDSTNLVDGFYKVETGYTVTNKIGATTTGENVCAGYKYTLPSLDETDSGIPIGWYCEENKKLYAQNSTIVINQNMTFTAKYLGIKQSNGASVLKGDTHDNSGIRFNFNLNQTSYNAVSSFVKAVGIIVMPEDMIGLDKEFSFENYGDDVIKIELSKSNFKFESGNMPFNASIIDLKPSNLSRQFAARAYAIIDCDGVDTYVYVNYDKVNNARKIIDVAASAIKAGESDVYKTMEKYIDKVLNLKYENNTFTVNDKLGRTSDAIAKSVSSKTDGGVITLTVTVNKELFTKYCGGAFSSVCINEERFKINSQSVNNDVVTLKIPKENEVKWNRVMKNADIIKIRPNVDDGKIKEMFSEPINFGGGLKSSKFISTPTGKETPEQLGKETQLKYGDKIDVYKPWVLAQWGCTHDIGNGTFTRNGSTVKYDDGAKSVMIDTAKEGSFSLSIKGSEEYTRDAQGRIRERTGTENWPHILLSANVAKPIDVSLYKHIYFEIDYEVTKCESKVDRSVYPIDVSKNAAQFQWFVSIYDYNSATQKKGRAFWFGFSMFDTRQLGGTPLATYQIDAGKVDSTGIFIYMPSLTEIDRNENCKVIGLPTSVIGKHVYVKYDLMPFITLAVEKVKAQGVEWKGDQIYFSSSNIGWELPGNFDAAATVNHMNFWAEYK